jgi:hypothetical protein
VAAPVPSARFLSTTPGERSVPGEDLVRWQGHVAAGRIGEEGAVSPEPWWVTMLPDQLARHLANEALVLGPEHPRGLAVMLRAAGVVL